MTNTAIALSNMSNRELVALLEQLHDISPSRLDDISMLISMVIQEKTMSESLTD